MGSSGAILAQVALVSCALGGAGCHTGNAGVHAIVTLDTPDASPWGYVAFDHITVTATSSSHVAVVCLFPRAEGQRALVVPSPSSSDPDPCADLHNGYAGVNTVYPSGSIYDDWDLVVNPWTLNFDGLSSGDLVSVDARGIFGGAAAVGAPVGVMDVKASARADPSFPNVSLAFSLPPNDDFWGAAGAHCDQGDDLDTYDNPSTFSPNSAAARSCPRFEAKAAYTTALTPVTTSNGEVGRIPAVVSSGCDGGEPDGVIVWKSDPIALDGGCVSVELDGRFAECDPADPGDAGLSCKTSVRCVPPPTDLAVLAGGTVLSAQNISCVPTYPEPVGYVLEVSPADIDAGEFAIGLRRKPSEPPQGTCFFDVWNFFWTPGCN